MPFVEVWVDDPEVMFRDIQEFEDDQILKEYERRFGNENDCLIDQIYETFRDRTDTPQCLRDFIWKTRGRIL